MIAWLVASTVVIASCIAVLVAVAHVTREVRPTRRALREFRSDLEPALIRVRTETAATRLRLRRESDA